MPLSDKRLMAAVNRKKARKRNSLLGQRLEQCGEIVGAELDIDLPVFGQNARCQFGLALL
jgi:hypothetical protein